MISEMKRRHQVHEQLNMNNIELNSRMVDEASYLCGADGVIVEHLHVISGEVGVGLVSKGCVFA
jgi:hypothetical protein